MRLLLDFWLSLPRWMQIMAVLMFVGAMVLTWFVVEAVAPACRGTS